MQANLLIVKTDWNIFSAFLKRVWAVGYACFMLSFRAGDLIVYSKTKVVLYRMFHEKTSMCWEVISSAIVRIKNCINMYQILNGYRDRTVWIYKYKNIVTDNEARNITHCYPVNKANLVHNFSWYVYFFSLHVSGYYVPIIRRNNCIYETLDNCHSVWMTVCSAGW